MTAPQVYYPVLGYVRAELIINAILVSVVFCVVSLRVAGRLMGPGIGMDDGFIMLAAPLGLTMVVCGGIFAPLGSGWNLTQHPELAANIPFILQLTFGMQIVYVILLASVKASMLCFFLRVFPTSFMQTAAKVSLVFVAIWTVSYLCSCIFLCTPVSAQWTGQGTCGAYIPMIQSLIATNAIGDLVIMALPMRSIWSLQTRTAEKIGITSCFALGLACVVCAVFRLIYISTVDLNANVTGTMPTTIFLFSLEPNLAILCVSIPMLRPFYAKYKKRMGGSRLDESTHDGSKYRDRSQPGQSKVRTNPDPENASWEMENYYPNAKKNEIVTKTGYVDEASSEKNLTRTSSGPSDEIRVETGWTVSVTRNDL